MDFQGVAEFFDRVEQTSSRLEMTDHVAEMFSSAPPAAAKIIVYLSQGKLGPDFNSPEIGLGEKLVQQAIARAAGYTGQQVDTHFKETGDLGITAEQLLGEKKQSSLFSEKLSLDKVFSSLEKIATTEGSGSQDAKLKRVAELLNSASPIEARYITRTILGKLRLGIGDPTLMDALAINNLQEYRKQNKTVEEELEKEYKKEEDVTRQLKFKLREAIEAKYNIHPDLGDLARLLKEKGLAGLKDITIVPGIPIRPTLAERLPSSEDIVKKLGTVAVEAKYDGFRFQVHKNGKDITIYSRKQENMTHMFPEIVKGVQEQITAKKAIVEGEALAVNEETNEYFPFQITIQRKRKHGISEKAAQFPLKLFLFDVMFVDGRDTMQLPFAERRKVLEKLLAKGNVVELTETIVTDNPEKITAFFEQCIEKGLEGIMAKDLQAPYIAGARKFAWVKLKRSYRGELGDTIDVVLIGYYEGKGKRKQFGLGTLLGAVYNKQQDRFESIAKIGTGLSEQQLGEYEGKLKKIVSKTKPQRVESGPVPDYWVSPQQVVEVLADEITRSPIHAAGKENMGDGYALRFPRLVKAREDKDPEQATTVKEIKSMFKKQKHVQLDD